MNEAILKFSMNGNLVFVKIDKDRVLWLKSYYSNDLFITLESFLRRVSPDKLKSKEWEVECAILKCLPFDLVKEYVILEFSHPAKMGLKFEGELTV